MPASRNLEHDVSRFVAREAPVDVDRLSLETDLVRDLGIDGDE
jgi:hypothetical protein